jgi:hypothetical protein
MAEQLNDETAKLDQQVRYSIFRHFMETGKAPSVQDTAAALAQEPAAIVEAYRRLEANHALALAPTTTNIWMCHPFSAIPTRFLVKTTEREYWANCAWDALSLSATLGADTSMAVRCPDCGTLLTATITAGSLNESHGVVHIPVPPRQFWDNVGFT